MSQRERQDLDRYITGNFGEDSVPDELTCPECKKCPHCDGTDVRALDDADVAFVCKCCSFVWEV